jgi:hypothetical protein
VVIATAYIEHGLTRLTPEEQPGAPAPAPGGWEHLAGNKGQRLAPPLVLCYVIYLMLVLISVIIFM